MLKIYRFIAAVVLLVLPGLVWADVPSHTVKKSITKIYAVKAGMQVFINNQYGDIKLQGWKQKKLVVKIMITSQSPNLLKAGKLLGLVSIKSGRNAGGVKLETIIDTSSRNLRLSTGDQCHISYQVFVPAGLHLDIKNSFGNTKAESVIGDLTIAEKFGDIKAVNLTGFLKLNIRQGSLDIDRLSNSVLNIQGFNTVTIGTASGDIDATFSSGGRVDLGLSDALHKLSVVADNVRPLNITNLKMANADLKIHTSLSKTIYNDHILLKLGKRKPLSTADSLAVAMAKDDTSKKTRDKILRIKKLSLDALQSKTQDYELKTGTAVNIFTINASFSVLNVKD